LVALTSGLLDRRQRTTITASVLTTV